MSSFQAKIDKSINIIQRAATIATKANKPLIVAFSGGKDSQVLYHLAQAAQVEFTAVYNATTIDPPEVVRFIRTTYPNVQIDCPEISFWDLCKKKRMLPTQRFRFCCNNLKENKGRNNVTLTGVRREESARRAKRGEVNDKKKGEGITIDEFERQNKMDVQCFGKGQEKITINPILEWTEHDVWHYLNEVLKVPHCKLYDQGRRRVGCLFCPMKDSKQILRDCNEYPHQFKRLMSTICYIVSNHKERHLLTDPISYFKWWISRQSIAKFKTNESLTLPFSNINDIEEVIDFSPWRQDNNPKENDTPKE